MTCLIEPILELPRELALAMEQDLAAFVEKVELDHQPHAVVFRQGWIKAWRYFIERGLIDAPFPRDGHDV